MHHPAPPLFYVQTLQLCILGGALAASASSLAMISL